MADYLHVEVTQEYIDRGEYARGEHGTQSSGCPVSLAIAGDLNIQNGVFPYCVTLYVGNNPVYYLPKDTAFSNWVRRFDISGKDQVRPFSFDIDPVTQTILNVREWRQDD